MSDQFRQWLTSEMERRRYSQGALAKAIGMSRPFVTRVLSGDKAPSVDFCLKVAQAFELSPVLLLVKAGILPAAPESEDDPTIQEITDIARSLPSEDQKEILEYVRFRYHRRKG